MHATATASRAAAAPMPATRPGGLDLAASKPESLALQGQGLTNSAGHLRSASGSTRCGPHSLRFGGTCEPAAQCGARIDRGWRRVRQQTRTRSASNASARWCVPPHRTSRRHQWRARTRLRCSHSSCRRFVQCAAGVAGRRGRAALRAATAQGGRARWIQQFGQKHAVPFARERPGPHHVASATPAEHPAIRVSGFASGRSTNWPLHGRPCWWPHVQPSGAGSRPAPPARWWAAPTAPPD